MSKPTEFHCFEALHAELRLQIWALALAEPRDVNITCDAGVFQRGIPRTAKEFKSSNKVPALLHVCHESRYEALKIYKPHFQTESSPRYTYISFSQDTITASDSILQFLKTPELQGIQKMILDVKDPAYFGHFNIDFLQRMQPNLKELELDAYGGEVSSWNNGLRYLGILKRDFVQAIGSDPEWRWPETKVIDAKTWKLFHKIVGSMDISFEDLLASCVAGYPQLQGQV